MASVIVSPEKPEVHKTRVEWQCHGLDKGMVGDELGLWGNVRNTPATGMGLKGFLKSGEMPNGAAGIPDPNEPHHDWSGWPCKDAGPLRFNQSAAPFASLKDDLSDLKGLDHAGGWSPWGHRSGDVFVNGTDMVGTQKTNSIAIDQVAVNLHGDKTRDSSLVPGTEGGTRSYGSSEMLLNSVDVPTEKLGPRNRRVQPPGFLHLKGGMTIPEAS